MLAFLKSLGRAEARGEPIVALPPVEAKPDPRADTLLRIREIVDLLEVDVARLIGDVMAAAGTTHEDMGRLGRSTAAIFGDCSDLASAAEHAARDVGRLAGATEELTSSSEEINRRLRDVSDLATGAKQITNEARASIDGLKSSSAEIMPIAGLISSIANRTNLLALNATIEAAHAGAAGRGFAVVAGEVKSLAVETQKATDEIARRLNSLQNESLRLFKAVDNIGQLIEGVWPVIAAISGAVEEQTRTTAEFARSTSETSRFVNQVSERAGTIATIVTTTSDMSDSADRSVQRVTADAEKLQSRFTVFLRQTEMGTRRRFDRLPCERAATLSGEKGVHDCRTIDLSEGGALLAVPDMSNLEKGTRATLAIAGIGRVEIRIVARSHMGLHVEWQRPSKDFCDALHVALDEIRHENADLVAVAIKSADAVAQAFEAAISGRRLTTDQLFDADYRLIEGSDPAQYETSALATLEELLPPLQEPLLGADERLVFAVAVDRNGWLPVHVLRYSQPQRRGDPVWNAAHSRNRRIFDDRAGLTAARNVRPSLIQTYNRDLGGGEFVMMKEVDAPIGIFGRHWGGFRMAYRI